MSRERTDSRESTEIRAIIICRGRSDKKAREARLGDGRGTRSRDFGWWGGREKNGPAGERGLAAANSIVCANNVARRILAGYLSVCTGESGSYASTLHSWVSDRGRHTWGVLVSKRSSHSVGSIVKQSRILFRNFDDEEMESRTACNVRGLALSRNPIIFISFGVITWRVGDLINLQTARIAGNND